MIVGQSSSKPVMIMVRKDAQKLRKITLLLLFLVSYPIAVNWIVVLRMIQLSGLCIK